MKSFKIPLILLLGMIFLALVSGAVMVKQCAQWEQQADSMAAHAAQGNWDEAQAVLDDMQSSWKDWETYLHTSMVHQELETVGTLLEECRVLLHQQNGDTLSLTAAQLRCQFEHLGELQSLSLSNLL